MPFEIYNLKNMLKVVYFISQSPISNICLDIVQLRLLLGSVDPHTHVVMHSSKYGKRTPESERRQTLDIGEVTPSVSGG